MGATPATRPAAVQTGTRRQNAGVPWNCALTEGLKGRIILWNSFLSPFFLPRNILGGSMDTTDYTYSEFIIALIEDRLMIKTFTPEAGQ